MTSRLARLARLASRWVKRQLSIVAALRDVAALRRRAAGMREDPWV
ncbi:MAG TPA: hypothetical protein VFX12_00635 [Vicinamibacterales bacterium]|nr:hypothetical protein [Vicinamibacterales bacterium]